jgi:MYXO-CTERM domain-containing protein
MKRPLTLPLTALATLLSTGVASASEWRTIEQGSPAAESASQGAQGARDVAQVYLKNASAELGLEGVELRFRNELSVGAHRTVRFTQWYAGLPVLGASAALHLTPDDHVKAVALDVARGLSVSAVPALGADAARKAVEGTLGVTLAEEPSTVLAVFPEDEGPGKLVWAVDVRAAGGGQRYLVDAHHGNIVSHRPLAVDVRGRVYPISSAVTPQPRDLELTDLDSAPEQQKLNGWNGNLRVTNYVSGGGQGGDGMVLEQSVVPNSGADFLYDPPASFSNPDDEFAQVGIYYHLTRMRDYFTSVHGLDTSTPSWKLVAVANMQDSGRPLDNAYFSPEGVGAPWNSPNLIAIGQGSQFDFADDSDVFLHEFTHYVSGNAIGYNEGQIAATEFGLSPWGGSIDEGTADYFACTVNNDSTLGEASLEILGAVRELSKADKKCPQDLMGEVHADGELIGSLAWSLRDSFGQQRGDKLVWGALSMLTKGASFGDFARGLQMAADDLATEGSFSATDVQTLQALVKSRGMDDCDAVLDLGGGKTRQTTMLGIDTFAQGFGGSCAQLRPLLTLQSLFHFKTTPAADSHGVRFTVALQALGGNDLDWSLYVRTGEHVGFSSSGFLPTVSRFDYSVENIKEAHGEIVIDENSDPPFDPSQTYYLVIGHANCPPAVATVSSVDLVIEKEPTDPAKPGPVVDEPMDAQPNADSPSEQEQPAGCACRAAGPSAPTAPWAALAGLALAGAVAVRRRSHRS